jgi:hypothetical protein
MCSLPQLFGLSWRRTSEKFKQQEKLFEKRPASSITGSRPWDRALRGGPERSAGSRGKNDSGSYFFLKKNEFARLIQGVNSGSIGKLIII